MFINRTKPVDVVASWLPGTEAAGISDVLFTDARNTEHDMTGRLSLLAGGAINPEMQKRPFRCLFDSGYV